MGNLILGVIVGLVIAIGWLMAFAGAIGSIKREMIKSGMMEKDGNLYSVKKIENKDGE